MPHTPYYILIRNWDNNTHGLSVIAGTLVASMDSGNNGIPLKFSPVDNTVEKILNDTEVRINTEDGMDVGSFQGPIRKWIITRNATHPFVFSNATFHIKKSEGDQFSIVYIGGDQSSQGPVNKEGPVNRDLQGYLYVAVDEADSPNYSFELLKK